MRIVFNGHGGRVGGLQSHPANFNVPANVSIHMFVADGLLLSNGNGWQMLNWLINGGNVPGIARITYLGGAPCRDYYGLPYPDLGIDGVMIERASPRGGSIWEPILRSLDSQRWGAPASNTVSIIRPDLPAVNGGNDYARDAILLSDLASLPNATQVYWLACREIW